MCAETEKAKEKVLLFSQSILLLNFIEEVIQKPETGFGEMIEGVHYYRLDGSTKQGDRADFMSEFNKENNRWAWLVLVGGYLNLFIHVHVHVDPWFGIKQLGTTVVIISHAN